MTGWIGIALGDVTGIGPEVTLKALAAGAGGPDKKFLLIGDFQYVKSLNDSLGTDLPIKPFENYSQDGRFFVFTPDGPLEEQLIQGSPSAAAASLTYLTDGAERCLRQELDGLVTAPVSKLAIIRTGVPFIGQTEFLSQLAGTERTAMMLLGHDEKNRWVRVVLATTHVPLQLVPTSLDQGKIELAVELASQACRFLGLPSSRVGVCGLNPHAGEGGELGLEEKTIILPAIRRLQTRHYDVTGPLPADTLFYQHFKGDYDVVVAMYHDQGLCPIKMIGFETGVNWSLGLPFIRTSPDHGTAYDIAGKGLANPSSMMSAINLAVKLSLNQDALAEAACN